MASRGKSQYWQCCRWWAPSEGLERLLLHRCGRPVCTYEKYRLWDRQEELASLGYTWQEEVYEPSSARWQLSAPCLPEKNTPADASWQQVYMGGESFAKLGMPVPKAESTQAYMQEYGYRAITLHKWERSYSVGEGEAVGVQMDFGGGIIAQSVQVRVTARQKSAAALQLATLAAQDIAEGLGLKDELPYATAAEAWLYRTQRGRFERILRSRVQALQWQQIIAESAEENNDMSH